MPVLLFVSYSGVLGGAERVLLDAAAGAAGLPAEVVVACPEGELAARARTAGLGVLALPRRSLDLRADRAGALRALVAHAVELRALAVHLQPDLLVAWGMRSAIAALLGAPPTPVAVAQHDFLPGPAIARAVRASCSRAVAVVVPSQAVGRDLDRDLTLGDRLHVVAPGIAVQRYADAAAPADPPEVLVLGSLVSWKRPELALEIFARARSRAPALALRLRLVGAPVTGSEPTLAALRARAGEPDLAGAVELAGASSDPRSDLARATCLLHCARREPFGLVLLEAMASARPVVAPDAAGPREIVDSECAWLYPPDDMEAAAGALLEVVGDRERAQRAGRAGRRRAQARFDRSQTRAGFARVLGDAVVSVRAGSPLRSARARAEDLTVVTVTHNSERELPGLLDSVRRHLPGARVVVADCASADATLEVARAHTPGDVEVVALDQNVGFGRACNRALAGVHTPVAALLNPDVELLDGSLLELVMVCQDPTERLLAPQVLNSDGSVQDTVHPVPTSTADLIRSAIPPAAIPGRAGAALAPWRSPRPRRVGWAVGCALVARTATLRALGPFDESIFLYGEDLELGLRAARAGVQTWLWPSARVVHHRARSSAAAFGGEPFARLARARHDVVARRLGPARAALDDRAQALTFASRIALKRALGRPPSRERRQLTAVRELRGRRSSR